MPVFWGCNALVKRPVVFGGSETVDLADRDAERTPRRSQQPGALPQIAVGPYGIADRGFEIAAVVPGHFQPGVDPSQRPGDAPDCERPSVAAGRRRGVLVTELPERADERVVELLGRLRLAELRDAAFNGFFHCPVRCPR